MDVAGGVTESLTGAGDSGRKTPWRLALSWFISSYPLLGALAAAFKLVEDAEVCRLHGIAVAAISPAAAELYVNPLCGFDDGERRFVIAHELLHAGLRHDTRGGGRDPWLWNVACDYVINGWLAEMAVGDLPDSALYDSVAARQVGRGGLRPDRRGPAPHLEARHPARSRRLRHPAPAAGQAR